MGWAVNLMVGGQPHASAVLPEKKRPVLIFQGGRKYLKAGQKN